MRTQHGPNWVQSRLVADACGGPVLRRQGPIGQPGAARPIKALTKRLLLATSQMGLSVDVRWGPVATAVNGTVVARLAETFLHREREM